MTANQFGRPPRKETLKEKVMVWVDRNFVWLLFCIPVTFLVSAAAAWLTHVVVCLLAGKWGFLIAGAIMFPIAIIHGVMIWFGFAG